MITTEELDALTQLLQRVPMSAAEVMWVNGFLARQQLQLAKAKAEAEKKAAEINNSGNQKE